MSEYGPKEHTMQREMKAIIMDRFGPSSVLEYRSVPIELPSPDEVVVEVGAVSVNRTLDISVRNNGDGRAVKLPHVLGVGPSGVIVELGASVRGHELGERVAVLATRCGQCNACLLGRRCERQFHPGVERWGGYAEYITVPSWTCRQIPDDLAFATATVMLRHDPTAHHLLETVAGVSPGERVLVLGAAGGLGSGAIEVALRLGATVIAGAGADERVAAAIALGAGAGINYRSEDLARRVMELTDGRGVDVLVENIGEPSLWSAAFACVAREGRVVTAGAHGGGTVPLDVRRLYQYRISIHGSNGRTDDDIDWVLTQHQIRPFSPLIGAIMPLAQARLAHDLVERNAITGKVVLDPHLHLATPTI